MWGTLIMAKKKKGGELKIDKELNIFFIRRTQNPISVSAELGAHF
jgi:hypothetical protein